MTALFPSSSGKRPPKRDQQDKADRPRKRTWALRKRKAMGARLRTSTKEETHPLDSLRLLRASILPDQAMATPAACFYDNDEKKRLQITLKSVRCSIAPLTPSLLPKLYFSEVTYHAISLSKCPNLHVRFTQLAPDRCNPHSGSIGAQAWMTPAASDEILVTGVPE
jgi:hypothetical protein